MPDMTRFYFKTMIKVCNNYLMIYTLGVIQKVRNSGGVGGGMRQFCDKLLRKI